MSKEFDQVAWDEQLRADWQAILRLAVCEDLGKPGERDQRAGRDQRSRLCRGERDRRAWFCDWTTMALVPEGATGRAGVVARQPGVVAGLPGVEMTLHEIEPRLQWSPEMEDGQTVRPGDRLGLIDGPAWGVLGVERLVLNLLGRLSGIATLTRKYVEAVSGTKAQIYDTRKTTPGWRRLEKYAVRCGGGRNHRTGLFDAVLIKDNHLAVGAGASSAESAQFTPAEAVARARQFLRDHARKPADAEMIVEVEVDTLEQLDEVLPAGPDIVLLDNFSPAELVGAVVRRDAVNPTVELEASGGVNLETVQQIAASGVDRISVGALTHSAVCLDLGLDWL